jgi:hypothetical protein
MGPSEIEDDFWSCSESGLDGYNSGEEEDQDIAPQAHRKATDSLEDDSDRKNNLY